MFVIFFRDSQISTQIVHNMQICAKEARPGLASFKLHYFVKHETFGLYNIHHSCHVLYVV